MCRRDGLLAAIESFNSRYMHSAAQSADVNFGPLILAKSQSITSGTRSQFPSVAGTVSAGL